MKIDIVYWIKLYQKLRLDGNYKLSDQLREMIRRMGFVIESGKSDIKVKEV